MLEPALDFACLAFYEAIDPVMLGLQSVKECVGECTLSWMTLAWNGDSFARTPRCVLLDQVFEEIVIDIIYGQY